MSDDQMYLEDPAWYVIFAYSEWLDAEQHLIVAPEGDERTHATLVNTFLAANFTHKEK